MAPLSYRRHRFPPEIIQHAIWLYLRFTLSYRDVEELLAERGLDVSYETVRRWVLKFGPLIARKLRQGRRRPSARWHLFAPKLLVTDKLGSYGSAFRQLRLTCPHDRVEAAGDALVLLRIDRLVRLDGGIPLAVAVGVEHQCRPALRLGGVSGFVEHLGVEPTDNRAAAARRASVKLAQDGPTANRTIETISKLR